VLKRLTHSFTFLLGLVAGRLLIATGLPGFSHGEYRWGLDGVDQTLFVFALMSLLYIFEPWLWRALLGSDEQKLQKGFFWRAWPIYLWLLIGVIWQWGTHLLAVVAWGAWLFSRFSLALRFSKVKESFLERTRNLPGTVFLFTAIPFAWAAFSSSPKLLICCFVVYYAALFIFCRDNFRPMAFESSLAAAPMAFSLLLPEDFAWRDAALASGLLLFTGALLLTTSLRKKQIRAYAPVMWAVTILALAGAETTLHQTKYAKNLAPRSFGEQMASDEILFFVPEGFRPGVGGFDVRKFKFRSGEATQKKPPGVFRILCVGGSSTWGKGVEDNETWPFLLEKKLIENGIDAQVINAGLPGYSSFQILILLREYLLSYDPDVVLMYAGFNDMALSAGPYTMRELWSMMRGEATASSNVIMRTQEVLSPFFLYNALQFAIVGARRHMERSGEVIVANRHEFVRNIREISELCAKTQVRFLAMAEATQYDDDYYHSGLGELAKRRNFPFVDVYAEFRRNPGAIHWFSDVVHLTPEGNLKLADMTFEFLEMAEVLP